MILFNERGTGISLVQQTARAPTDWGELIETVQKRAKEIPNKRCG